jgi:hypothetical protein
MHLDCLHLHISFAQSPITHPHRWTGPQPVEPNKQWLSRKNLDGLPIPNVERSNWEFLLRITPYCCRVNLDSSTELALEGGLDDKPSHMESFHLTLNHPMDPLHTSICDDPLSLSRSNKAISIKTFNFLSNLKFDGEGHVYASTHLI